MAKNLAKNGRQDSWNDHGMITMLSVYLGLKTLLKNEYFQLLDGIYHYAAY